MQKIPRCMSTQHPDNAIIPFFSEHSVMEGDAEIREAYYAYSHLGCTEQMWDSEGKEADDFVVKKLLTNYDSFFKRKKLGEDVFLTLRVPNPAIEKDEAKILLETLESIPRSFDIAQKFYNNGVSPIFEVILPMTGNAAELNRIYHYYRDFVVGKKNKEIMGMKISEWTGDFHPEEINIIPLFEMKDEMLNCASVVGDYLKDKKLEYQRVFLARSDPAINYGSMAAVLINKVALQRLHNLQQKISVDIYPMIGVGSCPFRGNFTPQTAKNSLSGYPSVQTYTIQSAFKYDHDEKQVVNAVDELNNTKRKEPIIVDENRCIEIINKISEEYRKQIKLLLPTIQELSVYVPQRRKRKMHIGLYRYSRQMEGMQLPRAIPFCAVLYSIGIVPDVIGLNALSQDDIDYLHEIYPNFEEDYKTALKYFNPENFEKFPELKRKIEGFIKNIGFEPNEEHRKVSSQFMENISKRNFRKAEENMLEMATLRKFLG